MTDSEKPAEGYVPYMPWLKEAAEKVKRVMKCCTVVDRDDNGARGIFLRALAAPPFEDNFNAFVAN